MLTTTGILKYAQRDRFGSTNTCYGILPRYKPLAYFDAEKYSLGINCIPANNNTLEIKGEDVYAALFYSSSETFTISNKLFCPGTLLYTEVFFSIPIPKSAKNVTPTLTTLKINACRNSSGYLFSGGSYTTGGYDILNDSSLTTTIEKATNNQLFVKIHPSSALVETNMTQVIVEINAITVTFA